MQKLTIKELINKVLGFNLYSLGILKKPIVIIGSICLVIYLLVPMFNNLAKENIEQKEKVALVLSLKNAQLNWDLKYKCIQNLTAKNLTREDFDYYIQFTKCYNDDGEPFSESFMEFFKAGWDNETSRLTNYIHSNYYSIGKRPTRCVISGELTHCF